MAYIKVENKLNKEFLVDGFITFIYVDEKTKACPHNLSILPETDEDKELYKIAKELKK